MSMSTSNTHEAWRSTKDPIKNGLPESNSLHNTLPDSDNPHTPGLAGTTDQYQDTHVPAFHDVKKALAFLVARNAQLRLESGSTEELLSDRFRSRLQGILTNDICETFAQHVQGIQKQAESLSLTGVEGSPIVTDTNSIPKAPQAMSISERVRILEDMLLLQDQKALNGESQNPTPPSLHTSLPVATIPIPIPSILSSASILDNNQTAPVSAGPATAQIAIPLDPKFLSAFKSREREEGEISSSSIISAPSKTSSADPMKGNRPADENDYSRRSTSVELSRHRLPSSRTYRSSRSPGARRRRWSPSRSSRRSPSPSYTKRNYSPDRRYNRRSPSPRTDRRYKRTPLSPTTRPSRALGHKSVPPSSPRRRNSEYDTRSKPSRYEPFRAHTLPESGDPNCKTRRQRSSHERNISAETISSDYRRSNHERHNREEQEPDLSNQLMSPASKEASNRVEGRDSGEMRIRTPMEDIVMEEQGLTLTSDVSMQEPVSQSTQEHGLMEESSLAKSGHLMQITKMSCHNIPGIWMVKSGLETVEILSCEFEIDKTIAQRWGIHYPSRHGKEKEHDSLSLQLVCVPLSDLEAVESRLGKSAANPEDIADAVGKLETVWPPAGHLVIEVNPDRDWGRSWLPRHLGEDQGAIEIIDHVHEGTNVIRLIQLAGLNNFTFLVVARITPPYFYCLEPESIIALNGEGQEAEGSQTDDRLLKDFLTSIQITYS